MWVQVAQGKGSKERRIPVVSKSLQISLRKYVKGVAPTDSLFPMKSRNLHKLVARIGREAGFQKGSISTCSAIHRPPCIFARKRTLNR